MLNVKQTRTEICLLVLSDRKKKRKKKLTRECNKYDTLYRDSNRNIKSKVISCALPTSNEWRMADTEAA